MRNTTMTLLCGLAILPLLGPVARAEKNWTAPAHKIYAQTLSDQIMKDHPELLSVTFHGSPPDLHDVFTMFAGSFPDRIGNQDDPDDIDVIQKGITIVDPRWKRTADDPKKFVVLMPLRDQKDENIGLIVYAFKNPTPHDGDERTFFAHAMELRDALRSKIATYPSLFAPSP